MCVPVLAHAQRVTDEKLYLEGAVDAGVAPKVDLEASQQLRLGIDAGFDETHTQLEVKWRAIKFLRFGALYRLIVLDNEIRHRVAGDVELRGKTGKLTASYRLRLQETLRDANDRLALRNRGQLSFEAADHIEPFFSLELLHQLSPNAEFRELRIVVGVDFRLAKHLDATGYYRFEDESNVRMPERNHILGFGVLYHFGDLRKSDPGPRD